MKDHLGTYLHDHLAGATFAVEMLDALKEVPSATIKGVAKALWSEVEEDRITLEGLANRVSGNSGSLKEAVAWVVEKAARLKLRRASANVLGTYETLEALALGILGKEHLWQALGIAAQFDLRLRGLNYANLAARARSQHAIVERVRLRLVPQALRAGNDA